MAARPWVLASVILAMAVPSVAAAPVPVVAEFAADSVRVEGQAEFAGACQALVFVSSGRVASISWSLRAEAVEVKIYLETRRAIVGTVAGTPVYRGVQTHDFSAANVSLVTERGQAPFFAAFASALRPSDLWVDTRVQRDARFDPRFSVNVDVPPPFLVRKPPPLEEAGSYRWTERDLEAPTLSVQSAWWPASFALSGNFTVRVWDHLFKVVPDRGSSQEFVTGHRYTNQTMGGPGMPAGVVADSERRYGEIELRNATMTLNINPFGGQASLNMASAELSTGGLLDLSRTRGSWTAGGTSFQPTGANMSLDADDVQLRMAPSRGADAIQATLTGSVVAAWRDGVPLSIESVESVPAVIAPAPSADPWPLVAGAVAGLGVLALVVRRLRSDGSSQDFARTAAHCIERDDYDALLKAATRRLKEGPLQPNVAACYAIALQKLDRPMDSVEFLRSAPARSSMEGGLRQLLCCLGLFQAGRELDAAIELEGALKSSQDLAQELEGTDLWDKAIRFPRLRRILQAENAAVGYG